MSRSLPPLVALRAFEAVGRLGSVGAAADELCVSHSVVSRHVANLEARLGVDLIEPRGRSVALTEAGRTYLGRVTRAFDAIARATQELKPSRVRRLDIRCIPGLANRGLLRHLGALEERVPDTEIMLQPTLAHPDLLAGEADAEIVYGEDLVLGEGLAAQLVMRPRVFPVASPAFLDRFGGNPGIEDLERLPLIHEESTEQWERWLDATGFPPRGALKGMRLWHAHLAIEAARLGQGVALANEALAADDLASRTLVEIGQTNLRLGGYYLVASAKRWEDADIRAVREWLLDLYRDVAISA